MRAFRCTGRPGPGRRWIGLGLLAAAMLLLAGSAAPAWAGSGPGPAATGSPSGASGSSSAAGGSGTGASGSAPGALEGQPSAAEVAAAQARAAALHAQVNSQAASVGAARAALAAAAQQSSLALERYRTAVLGEQQAVLDQWHQEDLLRQSQIELSQRRSLLEAWVLQSYSTGGMLSAHPLAYALMSGGATDDLALTTVVLRRLGDDWSSRLNQVRAAEEAQVLATTAAEQAADQATGAAADAVRARQSADTAVAAQQSAVDALQSRLAGSQSAAAAADRQAALLAQARALADRVSKSGGNRVTGQVGSCAGGDVSAYPNGMIPISTLCPVWGAADQYLRADAAYAFDRMSQAYAANFGTPICITDTYRSYDEQVRVYAERPNLAAVPGTSNHGWGTAADLCGGIEQFGTVQHQWLLLNAPLFGWFHPAWAEPTGTKPEPWHWEYGG